MEISEEIFYNILQDFKKKDIHPVDRAELIKTYLKDKKISERQLARQLDMSHSTLQDWTSYGKITRKNYDAMLDKGYTKKEVYELVRRDRKNTPSRVKNFKELTVMDLQIRKYANELRRFILKPNISIHSHELVNELKNTLNRLELIIEMKEDKNGK